LALGDDVVDRIGKDAWQTLLDAFLNDQRGNIFHCRFVALMDATIRLNGVALRTLLTDHALIERLVERYDAGTVEVRGHLLTCLNLLRSASSISDETDETVSDDDARRLAELLRTNEAWAGFVDRMDAENGRVFPPSDAPLDTDTDELDCDSDLG